MQPQLGLMEAKKIKKKKKVQTALSTQAPSSIFLNFKSDQQAPFIQRNASLHQ